MKIRIGIAGYGNLGRGVESAVTQSEDMELVGVFTRRAPESVKTCTGAPVYRMEGRAGDGGEDRRDGPLRGQRQRPAQADPGAGPILLRGGQLRHPRQNPRGISPMWTPPPKRAASLALISAGWDPGLFSLNRLYGQAVLPNGRDYTFWGKGVSQGHSDAIRRIPGVKDAKQYTIPVEAALEAVRRGENPELTTRQKHTRECFVVAEEGADQAAIEQAIKTMPNYFDEYDTTVHFITQEELDRDHSGIPHGGMVFRTGTTGLNGENRHVIEYKLTLDSTRSSPPACWPPMPGRCTPAPGGPHRLPHRAGRGPRLPPPRDPGRAAEEAAVNNT